MNNNSRCIFVFSLLCAANVCLGNSAPTVSIIEVFQRADDSGVIDINYRLSDADGDDCTVSVEVSDDGGNSWEVAAMSLSGDVGYWIEPGTRHIIWDSIADLPDRFGINYCIKLTADDRYVDGPAGMEWVSIDDPGTGHGGFTGEMSRYETTNGQFCEYLNAALADGILIIHDSTVFDFNDINYREPYFDTYPASSYSQITYSDGHFKVRQRDGQSMANHPVVEVSWFGARAFCDYYGYRLPTEWEWQAVADFDSSFEFGCGETIDLSKANYFYYGLTNPVLLSEYPYTTPVNYYDPYGYGMNDMAGNLAEWTASIHSGTNRIVRGGDWLLATGGCSVWFRGSLIQNYSDHITGFRACIAQGQTGSGESGAFTVNNANAICPDADLNDDCVVNVVDLAILASQWLSSGGYHPEGPVGMEWVWVNDPGIVGHEGFNGEMSVHETTNGQYCEYLNAALSDDLITVFEGTVYSEDDSNHFEPFFDTYTNSLYSQIIYSEGRFRVRSRNGYSMANHPVVEVSWFGAKAFCDYYDYRLPTQWEWQAVADFDGSYAYGCGEEINLNMANYYWYGVNSNPLGLSDYPFTSPVDYYPAYGYGIHDMAGNVWEWTASIHSGTNRVVRGGDWLYGSGICSVSFIGSHIQNNSNHLIGFRVCR